MLPPGQARELVWGRRARGKRLWTLEVHGKRAWQLELRCGAGGGMGRSKLELCRPLPTRAKSTVAGLPSEPVAPPAAAAGAA